MENPIAETVDSRSIHKCTIRLCGRRRKRSRIAFIILPYFALGMQANVSYPEEISPSNKI